MPISRYIYKAIYQLGIEGIKKKVTYSVALIIAFLAGENENRQPEDLSQANFSVYLKFFFYQ